MSDRDSGGSANQPLSDVFVKIAELASATGAAPINRLAGCWTFDLGVRPEIRGWVNGHREPQMADGSPIPPFHAYLEWNGFPFAMLSPYGGSILQSPSRRTGAAERLLSIRLTHAIREARHAHV